MANSTPKIKQHIQTTEQIALRLITKIRHPENPLHNPSNELLYDRTKMTRISERLLQIQAKYKGNRYNWTILLRFGPTMLASG